MSNLFPEVRPDQLWAHIDSLPEWCRKFILIAIVMKVRRESIPPSLNSFLMEQSQQTRDVIDAIVFWEQFTKELDKQTMGYQLEQYKEAAWREEMQCRLAIEESVRNSGQAKGQRQVNTP